jgi:hypothetical protein
MLADHYKIADFLLKVFTTPLDVPSSEREALIKETAHLLKGRVIPLHSSDKQMVTMMRGRKEEVAKAIRKGESRAEIYARFQRELLPEFERNLMDGVQRQREELLSGLHDEAGRQVGHRQASQALLEEIRRQAQPVLDFLEKGYVFITPHLQVSFSRTPQGIEETLAPAEASAWIFTYLILPLFRTHPFPFGQCAVCGQVFVQAHRGKPRRYCSSSCRAKGMPSAAKRTGYMRTQRQRQRKRELDTAQRLRRKASSEQKQLELLGKEFPQKSRRQLLHLLKRATQTLQEVTRGRIQ